MPLPDPTNHSTLDSETESDRDTDDEEQDEDSDDDQMVGTIASLYLLATTAVGVTAGMLALYSHLVGISLFDGVIATLAQAAGLLIAIPIALYLCFAAIIYVLGVLGTIRSSIGSQTSIETEQTDGGPKQP